MSQCPSFHLSCDNLSCNIWLCCCGDPVDQYDNHSPNQEPPTQPPPTQGPHNAPTAVYVPHPSWDVPASRATEPPNKAREPPPAAVTVPARMPSERYDPPQPAWAVPAVSPETSNEPPVPAAVAMPALMPSRNYKLSAPAVASQAPPRSAPGAMETINKAREPPPAAVTMPVRLTSKRYDPVQMAWSVSPDAPEPSDEPPVPPAGPMPARMPPRNYKPPSPAVASQAPPRTTWPDPRVSFMRDEPPQPLWSALTAGPPESSNKALEAPEPAAVPLPEDHAPSWKYRPPSSPVSVVSQPPPVRATTWSSNKSYDGMSPALPYMTTHDDEGAPLASPATRAVPPALGFPYQVARPRLDDSMSAMEYHQQEHQKYY